MNNIISKLNLTDIDRTLYPTTAEQTFFSSIQRTVSRTEHVRS